MGVWYLCGGKEEESGGMGCGKRSGFKCQVGKEDTWSTDGERIAFPGLTESHGIGIRKH